MTTAVTMVIMLYAVNTKTDFTTHEVFTQFFPILFTCLICLILCSIFMSFSSWWHPLIAGVFVLIYGMYLVHDVQLIEGDKKYSLSYDDYVVGAMIIYIDIVMLFIELLAIFGDKK